MKRIAMIATVLCICIAFVSTVFAQAKPAEKPAVATEKGPAAKAQEKKFAGVVTAVDVKAKSLTAKDPLAPKDKKSEIMFDVAMAKFASGTKLEELKVGDNVAVEYAEKDGKNVATAVAKAPAKPEKEKKADEAKPAPAPAKK